MSKEKWIVGLDKEEPRPVKSGGKPGSSICRYSGSYT